MKHLYFLFVCVVCRMPVFAQTPSVSMVGNSAFYYEGTSQYSCTINPNATISVNGTYTPGGGDGGWASGTTYNGRPAYRMTFQRPFAEGYLIFNGFCVYGGRSFSIWWNGGRWVLGYKGQTGPNQFQYNNALYNGINTAKPPCEGWPGGGHLTGDCQTFVIGVTVPQGGPSLNPNGTTSIGIVNTKNAYKIPETSSNGYASIYWDGSKWVIEWFSTTANGRVAVGEILSTNTVDNGDNPPCSGWTGGYQFSGAICEGGPAGMPVSLLSFDAMPTAAKAVRIDWRTGWELNAAYYGIERSKDMIAFESISQIMAIGTTTSMQTYTYSDENPLKGRSYYRLRQVDQDGKERVYPAVSVRTTGTDLPYPNPVIMGDVLRIEAPRLAKMALIDSKGVSMPFVTERIDDETVEIRPHQQLVPGIYVISVNDVSHKVIVK